MPLLATRSRYNRLVDTFLGITACSLENHHRTKVQSIGQIEIDEIYAAVARGGRHFVILAQAKVGSDKIGFAQLFQDLAYCRQEYPTLICRRLLPSSAARARSPCSISRSWTTPSR